MRYLEQDCQAYLAKGRLVLPRLLLGRNDELEFVAVRPDAAVILTHNTKLFGIKPAEAC